LFENFGSDGPGFIPITGIKGWLAAADQVFGTDDAVAEPFENLDHADAGTGKERIDEAGDKQRDNHGR
jgi:hypothetical protein